MIIFIHLGPNRRDSPFTCVCLHSDRAPPERKANLQKFKVLVTIYFILEIFVNYLMRFLGNREYLLTNDFFLFFQNGDVHFLICTDVAARGIDITGLPYGKWMNKSHSFSKLFFVNATFSYLKE